MRFYNNYLTNIAKTPNQTYVDGLQASIDSQWMNSTQIYEVLEQSKVGENNYNQLEVSIDMVIDMGTGVKKSDDFKTFSFKDLQHDTQLGLMYQFSNNYWIITNTSDIASVVKSAVVRRCNNTLRWINPVNGFLNEYPCVIEYEAGSPQIVRDKDINTPDNHYVLIVQGNKDTLGLKVNQRFVFNGRAYKLTGYNNSLQNSMVDDSTTLLYYDLYLDIEQSTDDLINNIANKYEYDYYTKILYYPSEQVKGYKGKLDASAMLGDDIVDRNVVFEALQGATIDYLGNYTLIGESGTQAKIRAYIEGNPNSYDEADIKIVDRLAKDEYAIEIVPTYEEINQYESVTMYVVARKNSEITNDVVNITDLGERGTYTIEKGVLNSLAYIDDMTLGQLDYLNIDNLDGMGYIKITCLKPSTIPLQLTFSTPNVSRTIQIKLKSIF